jgi:ABC-type Fe3+ transport system substrate-binding protein
LDSTSSSSAPASGTAEEQAWALTLAAAKAEGRVILAGYPTDEARLASTEVFEQRHGITVQYEPMGGARGPALVERIRTEREAGQYRWDVYIGGSPTILSSFKPMGALQPIGPALLLTEVSDAKQWRRGLEFLDSEQSALVMMPQTQEGLLINSRLVRPGEIQAYRDLLDPKWKGQLIIHDPRITGPGLSRFAFLYARPDLGPDYIQALARQEPVLLRDGRQELDLLGQGKYPICIACPSAEAGPLIEKGVPIAVIDSRHLREGGYLSSAAGNVALFNPAPHPNAAKVYLNWLLGPEGQALVGKALGYPSARLDVTNDWVEPWQLPVESYWANYTEDAVTVISAEVAPLVRRVFGE